MLKKQRNISFEEIVFQIQNDGLLEIIKHPNNDKYVNQKIFVVIYNNYVYLVPFIEKENEIFLKTIFPGRKYTKKYLEDKNE
ncbi:MAG: hypothetical protein Q7J16_06635 [Candidatus Cloacimonadales bacterium]|nr:hypothetical protein [Candidatus Cloacimonadales bacterium]